MSEILKKSLNVHALSGRFALNPGPLGKSRMWERGTVSVEDLPPAGENTSPAG